MPRVRESRPPVRPASAVAIGALIGGLLGAVLLLVAEFTTLYDVRTSSGGLLVKSVSTGSNHSYAMVPIAVLAALLASVAFRAASRPALLALGVLGVLALLIALVGDLPSAHTSGLTSERGLLHGDAGGARAPDHVRVRVPDARRASPRARGRGFPALAEDLPRRAAAGAAPGQD